MCAWIRCCGGTSKKKGVIYKDGVFNVGMDNPGSYTYTGGATSVAANLLSDKFVLPLSGSNITWSIIGTSVKFDFTNFNTLKVRCKGISGSSNFGVSSAKNMAWDNRLAYGVVTSQVEHVITVDVSSITEGYIFFDGYYNSSYEVYEIWCE